MSRKVKKRHRVANVLEISPGERKLVELEGRSIGIFNVNGEFRAVLNICPHELAPICKGYVRGTTLVSEPGQRTWGRHNEILACPWHGWEFDLLTGECLVDKRRLHLFLVEIEADQIYVLI